VVPAGNLQICLKSKEESHAVNRRAGGGARVIHKPSIQDATEYVPMDAESDTGESTRPRGPF
jgi:hypothetical protein